MSARAVLKEEGTGKLSLRAAARHAGVSHAAAYYHFEDKNSLLAAIAVAAFKELNEAIQKASKPNESVSERLLGQATAYINFALKNPQEFRIMFLPELRSDNVKTEVEATARIGYEYSISIIKSLQEKQIVKPGNPEHICISLWAMIHGLATLMVDGPLYRNAKTQEGTDALITESVNHLFRGILISQST